jgi:peptide/nickel transport system permease protein
MAVAELTQGMVFVARRERNPWIDALHELLKNRMAVAGGIFIILILGIAIGADFVAPYGYAETHFEDNYAQPNAHYWLGADNLGRDILSRTI